LDSFRDTVAGAIAKHEEHHVAGPFHMVLVSISPTGQWFATDTGSCNLSDVQLAAALSGVVEDLLATAHTVGEA
jgi:hypothetical protein